MARIPYPDETTLPEEGKQALATLGSDMNIVRMMAHTGELTQTFSMLGGHLLTKTSIDPALRELAIIRTGILCGSDYEVHQHMIIARQVGIRREALAALRDFPESDVFDDTERAILRFTDDVIENGRAGDQTFNALRRMLNEREVMELTLCIGFYVMVCTFLRTYDVEIETPGTSVGPLLPRR